MCRTNAKIAGSGAVSDPCTSSTLCYPVVALLMELFILVNAINSRVSQSYLWIFLFFFFCIRWECGGGGEIKKTSAKTKYACENLPIYLVTRRTYVGHGSDSFCSAIRLYFLATLE